MYCFQERKGGSSGVLQSDLFSLEYASPVWANLPEYLSLLIEGVQKKSLRGNLSWASLQGRTGALWSSYSLGSARHSMH